MLARDTGDGIDERDVKPSMTQTGAPSNGDMAHPISQSSYASSCLDDAARNVEGDDDMAYAWARRRYASSCLDDAARCMRKTLQRTKEQRLLSRKAHGQTCRRKQHRQ